MSAWPGALLTSPVLRAVAPFAARLARFDAFPTVAELDEALRDRLGGVRLEQQVKKRRRRGPVARDALYEVRIHELGLLPTRERSWHDLTNALVWAAFPRGKRALTARQHALSVHVQEGARLPTRTREQDALAMIDEGGLLVLAEDARAAAAMARGDAGALEAMARAGEIALLVFGHALLEHAIAGELDVRGYGIVLDSPPSSQLDAADRALAAWLERAELRAPARWPGLPLSLAAIP